MRKIRNLYLIFNDMGNVHLGKDVFLTPYYIAKKFNLDLKVVFPETDINRQLKSQYRGAEFISKKFLGSKKSIFLIREFNFFKFIILKAKNIDNLMLFHLGLKTFFMGIIYKKINRKGKLYVKCDLDNNRLKYLQDYTENSLKRKILKVVGKLFLKNVDLLSVETKENYLKIIEKGILENKISGKIEYIPNGFDEELLEQLAINERGYEEKENIMITVGRIGTYEKNNEMLIEALENICLENWKILLIGPYEDRFKKYFDDFIKKNPDKKKSLLLIGNLEKKEEIYNYYDKAKVFLLTSRFEGFPLVYPEALRFGNYIITTDVGGANDITKDSVIGKVIKNSDIDSFREEVRKVIGGEINLKEKYEEAVKLSKEKFIWEKIINTSRKLEEIFIE